MRLTLSRRAAASRIWRPSARISSPTSRPSHGSIAPLTSAPPTTHLSHLPLQYRQLSQSHTPPQASLPLSINSPLRLGYTNLPSRSLISLSGPDASKFLQGIITRNIYQPPPPTNPRTEGIFAALLTAQGRLLYDVFIYPCSSIFPSKSQPPPSDLAVQPAAETEAAPGQHFLIEVDKSCAPSLVKYLTLRKLRAKIKIKLLAPDEATVWHIWDETDSEISNKIAAAAAAAAAKGNFTFLAMKDTRAPNHGTRVIRPGPPSSAPPSSAPSAPRVTEQHYAGRRYCYGVPEGQAEIGGAGGGGIVSIPQEGNIDLMGGIDWRKGCYVGQELTIRTRHRGVVRKRVLPVVLSLYSSSTSEGDTATEVKAETIPPGTEIKTLEGGKGKIGRWLTGIGNLGLALVRFESVSSVRIPGVGTPALTKEQERREYGMVIGGGAGEEEEVLVKVEPFVPEWFRKGVEEEGVVEGE